MDPQMLEYLTKIVYWWSIIKYNYDGIVVILFTLKVCIVWTLLWPGKVGWQTKRWQCIVECTLRSIDGRGQQHISDGGRGKGLSSIGGRRMQ
jgi:hypothetical protein